MGLTVLTVRRGGGFLYQESLLLSRRDRSPPSLTWAGSSVHAVALVSPARGHRDPAVKADLSLP